MKVYKQGQKSHVASYYAEHTSTRLQLHSSHLLWFTLVNLFQRSEVIVGVTESRHGSKTCFMFFFNDGIAGILSFKSAGLNMTVSHHPAAIQLFKKSSYWKSLFLCIAHFEMKRILMNTRLKSRANHVRFFQHAVINSDSNFNIIIWSF